MEVYSKPQIDEMGVKTAEKIKAAKESIPALTQTLGQSTTSATSQKLVTDELAKYYSSLAVQSRGMNLITNGTGLLGNNYNFSGLTFYPTDTFVGGGSFIATTANTVVYLDELIPVIPSKKYYVEAYLKSINEDTDGAAFIFSAPYDIDNNLITPNTYTYDDNVTELAAPLKVGDTTVSLVNVVRWDTQSPSVNRCIKIHEYVNAKGFKWGEKTYSRNLDQNIYSNTDIDFTTNTINLNKPWSLANPNSADGSWATGTKIGTSFDAGTFQYFTNLSGVAIPNEWTKGSGIIGGLTPISATQGYEAARFPSGTAFIKLGFLLNYYATVPSSTAVSGVYMTEITPENMQGQYQSVYNTTTALGANMVVDVSGTLLRSTSSERYKDILADVELSDELYNDAMQLKPIVYRSTADADNPRHHYYSFSAEVMGAFDPAFALWRYTELVDEIVTDADGTEITIQKEVKLDEPVAEGLNINAILALNHAISIKQNKMIADIAREIESLSEAVEQLKRDK